MNWERSGCAAFSRTGGTAEAERHGGVLPDRVIVALPLNEFRRQGHITNVHAC